MSKVSKEELKSISVFDSVCFDGKSVYVFKWNNIFVGKPKSNSADDF